jgi:hypothetical protein
MPLSISSFEERTTTRNYSKPIVLAFTAIVCLLCGFEAWARFSFFRISRIESRTFRDHAAALAVRPGTDAKPSILLLGNSLLLEALDYDRIRADLQSKAVPTRFVIEQTAWLDWFYGIRRLLAEGSRPDRIVLCLAIPQLLSNNLRGEYSAFYLIQTSDLVEAGRSSGYNASRISNLFFARYSLFYAGLTPFRNFVLNRVALNYADALRGFIDSRLPPYTDQQVQAEATRRLGQLQGVCSQYHVRCDLLLPPGFRPPGDRGLLAAGKNTGTTILIPVPLDAWGKEMYRDGFHVNAAGMERFTDLLAAALQQP